MDYFEYELELSEAVRKGKIKTVQELLSNDGIDELKDSKYFDYDLIIKAFRNSEIAIAKLLIDNGLRVYKKLKTKQTVLHYAVELEDIDLITTVLEKGASWDILTLNEQKKTPFHLAIDKDQSSIIELFLSQLDIKTLDEKFFFQYANNGRTIPFETTVFGDGFSMTKEASQIENSKIKDILLSYSSVKNMKQSDANDTASIYVASICGNLTAIKKYANSGLPINISLELSDNSMSYLSDYSGFTLLHFAVKHIKLDIVKFLLSKSPDILIQNENGSNPLHIAFESKEIGIWRTWQDFDDNNAIIDLLLEANTKFNSNPINKHELSHFHIACSRDESAIIEHFLKLGAPVNQPVSSECHLYKKFSPLHFAAKFRCKNTMELLLKNGADVKRRDYKEMTALHIAAKESCLETVSLLLQYGADVDSADCYGNTPLHWAFENKRYKILDLLLSVPDMANSNPTSNDGISHFHIACTRNNVDVVKSFIDNGVPLDTCIPAQPKLDTFQEYYNPYVSDWSGYSPVHLAVCHNKAAVVQLLLEKEANVGLKNGKGCNPLHEASRYPYEMFAEFIEDILSDLSKHGKLSQMLHSFTDITKVSENYASRSGSIEEIDWSSNRSEHLKIINSLFRNDIDVNCTDDKGNTSLFCAYLATNTPIVEMHKILQKNLGCSHVLSDQVTESLSNELRERRELIIDHFFTLNANLDQGSRHGSILHYIAYRTDEESGEMMEFFIKRGANVNARNDQMWTPLHCAVQRENEKLVRILLDNNADMNCADSRDNSTPLLMASKYPSESSLDITILLANRGANVNVRRRDGTTALHDLVSLCTDKSVARLTDDQVVKFDAIASAIQALIEAGADVNSRDSKGHTPLHVACRSYNYRIASLLLDYGADINVEDNRGDSVCCYVYDIYCDSKALYKLKDIVTQIVNVLRMHVVKLRTIGRPTSEKTLLSVADCADMTSFSAKRLTGQQEKELIEKCQAEVQALKNTEIDAVCTLYDVMFKSGNALSRLVKMPTFEAVVRTKSFQKKYENYGYLIVLKYEEGLKRGELLPKAKCVLNSLIGLELPDACSENICKYFENFELKKSVEMLHGVLNLKM